MYKTLAETTIEEAKTKKEFRLRYQGNVYKTNAAAFDQISWALRTGDFYGEEGTKEDPFVVVNHDIDYLRISREYLAERLDEQGFIATFTNLGRETDEGYQIGIQITLILKERSGETETL